MNPQAGSDRFWMEQALALAVLGEGTTSPNPRVGCVVVRDGRAVGRGFHRAAGEPHAEAAALSEAGERARGATLYVNLEPCAHYGRTPPCTDRIVRSGVSRVVASIEDPNPVVNGRGFRTLREAGVSVEVGMLGEAARRLNAAFLQWHRTGRPRVTLKAAISVDGMLAAAGGRSRWITGTASRRFAHRLRLRHDAVLVGAETVRRDDPVLTVRLEGRKNTPLRVVLAGGSMVRPAARVLEPPVAGAPRTRVYVAEGSDGAGLDPNRAEVVKLEAPGGEIPLRAVLQDLGRLGVQSLLVEGGGRTIGRFLSQGEADEAAIFVAPRLLGARGGTPLVDRETVPDPSQGWTIEVDHRVPLGRDLCLSGRIVPSGARRE